MRQRIGPWVLALLATACGSGGSPSAPSTTATPATVMTVVSGETEQPVAGVVVQASGQRYVTDAGGHFTLGSITNRNVLIEAPGFLRRDAFLFDGHGPHVEAIHDLSGVVLAQAAPGIDGPQRQGSCARPVARA